MKRNLGQTFLSEKSLPNYIGVPVRQSIKVLDKTIFKTESVWLKELEKIFLRFNEHFEIFENFKF
jgi:hypothetical protein